ncbi:MAG: hypothetical protein WCH11_03905 [Bdellovibrio sp.]
MSASAKPARISPDQIRKASMYFAYLFMNESWVLEGLREVSQAFLRTKNSTDLNWVQMLHRQALRIQKKSPVPQKEMLSSSGFRWPKNFTYESYLKLRSLLSFEQMEALLFVVICGFSPELTAQALGLSEGSLKLRIGKGLQSASSILANFERGDF